MPSRSYPKKSSNTLLLQQRTYNGRMLPFITYIVWSGHSPKIFTLKSYLKTTRRNSCLDGCHIHRFNRNNVQKNGHMGENFQTATKCEAKKTNAKAKYFLEGSV